MTKLKQYKMFIDGEWIDAENKKTFETLNPDLKFQKFFYFQHQSTHHQ